MVDGVCGLQIDSVIFGGDCNVRDEEARAVYQELGSSVEAIDDAWSFCGSPPEERWTWDTSKNDFFGKYGKHKFRFDRVFFVRGQNRLRPVSFVLIGKDRVPGIKSFPSDHWGVLTTWSHDDVFVANRSIAHKKKTYVTRNSRRNLCEVFAQDDKGMIDISKVWAVG